MAVEVNTTHKKDYPIGCVLSIGTGIPPKIGVTTGLGSVEGFIQMATNCETVHRYSESFYQPNYYRLNLSQGVSGAHVVSRQVKNKYLWGTHEEIQGYEKVMVSMDDWESIPQIREMTEQYLKLPQVIEAIEACAKQICDATATRKKVSAK